MAKIITGLISRATWKARFANGFAARPLPITEWFFHHSVTVAPDLVPPWDDDDAAVRRLEEIGNARFGGGISYTVPITPSGRRYEGHGIDRRGAHTYGHNTTGAAICFIGNYETMQPTAQQIEGAAQTMVMAHRQGLATVHTGRPHSDVYATACPGKNVRAKIPAINARAAALWAGGYGKPAPVVTRVTSTVSRTVTRVPLTLTGRLDAATIRQWQKVMGTFQDGTISTGVNGSSLVKAVQRRLGVTADGFLGPVTWRAIQRRLGVPADGVPGPITITALQRRLNTGKF